MVVNKIKIIDCFLILFRREILFKMRFVLDIVIFSFGSFYIVTENFSCKMTNSFQL